ncbi:hypothetical protein GC098_02270 [Paenibacillus sp. LMG 31458]|uniref:F5/8 type C domain-containing protein n=1 Tax=Paenibacillus phytorum TaxID=2654977 RepID=A0ABX1XP15_9BACL|nr:endo-alpha-N-acetylgalactosaminidase family protein [Paenibacillus phytorum]NOU70273.1 hypothetical protein [Paenibacillus phytorum]
MKKHLKQTGMMLTVFMGLQTCIPAATIFAIDQTQDQASVFSTNSITTQTLENGVYSKDYNDGNISGWTAAKGTTAFTPDNGTVKAVTQGAVILADLESPKYANGEYEVKLKFNQVPTRFGLVLRYADKNNYSVIQYDTSSWGWDVLKNGVESYGNINSSGSTFEANKQYTFKLRYENDSVQLWIDGVSVFNTTLPSLLTNAGQIGIRSWFDNKTFFIDDVKLTEVKVNNPVPKPITLIDTIASDQMTVEIDKEFPRVKKYVWKSTGAEMNGQLDGINELKINGKSYYPTATAYVKKAATASKGETAAYTLQIPEINVDLEMELELKNNVLNFNVTNIVEKGAEKVKTIEFPNHDLVSVLATQPKAQETAVSVTGGWNIINEEYNDLKSGATDVSGSRTYAFLNSDMLAATIVNNVVNGNDKVRVKVANDTTGTRKAAMSNGAWTYHGSTKPEIAAEPLPWAKIIITPDANNDSAVDWQDGAIAYRNHAEAPYRSEMIRDNISYIAMNIGSTTSSPFLRTFDNAKKISHLTDGFGQIVLHKGYQAEGHDDSHPDYGGHIGIRQGGKEDFNFILSEGKKYNIKGGVHINATEYMLDAFQTKMENMVNPLSKGWGWLDQAYYVDKTKDVESGELKRRLDMLKSDTGNNLDFVYVDVYAGVDWNAKKLAEYVNGNGWMLGTEFAGPLHEQAAWVHWGTDPGYPNQGNNSSIIRFIRNNVMDGFMSNPLLKGNKQVGVGYWQNNPLFYSYNKTTEAFFDHNLPTKYMQYFPIMKMTNDRIDFESNVSVARGQDGNIHLSKDGHDMAIMTDSSEISDSTVFIPWDPVKEDKIYHWNPKGGSTTWTVPVSWSSVQTAQLYKLTDLGRELVGSVPVTGGQVTLTAEKGIGYALYKDQAPVEAETVWGDGSPVKDAGFDSQKFNVWKKSSTAPNTDHIVFAKNSNAEDMMQVKGPNDAKIEQVITGLTPGKTYTASVWVKVDGTRKATIGVKQGDQEVVNSLEETNHKFLAQQHKYINTNFQRLKVSFDAASDKATLALNVAEGNATVSFDDVRVWENPTKTEKGDSVFFEDFENVDEGWGPFVYSKLGPVRTHLVETNGNQVKSYVLDDKYSLKTNEEGTGEWLRTLPQTLQLKKDNLFHLTMDYNADMQDMYTVAVRVNENGTVRDLASQKLNAGRGTLDLTFPTDGAKDAYLAIIKNFDNNQAELTGTLVVDNIRIDDKGPIVPVEGVLVTKISMNEQEVTVNKGNTAQINARVEPANAFNKTLEWSSDKPEVVSVDQTGRVTAINSGTATITATTKDGSHLSATSKVTVFEPNVLIPQSSMTATASSFQPGDDPVNALDGDSSTIWHTKWSPAHLPESITLNLGGSYEVNQIKYTPRSGAGNGTITKYNVYVSTDGDNFTQTASGTWIRDDSEKSIVFAKTTASYVRLEAIEAVGSFASAAEINVFRVPSVTEVAVTGVQLDKTQATLKEGQTTELVATVLPINATNKDVSWSSSDGTVVKVEVKDGKTIVTGLKAGTADVTVTTVNGSFNAVSKITVQQGDVLQNAATTLSTVSSVQSGKEFKVQLGLSNVTQSVYAQDIEVDYDPTIMEFISAKSLITGVILVETVSKTAGKLRFIVASEGAGHAVTGNAQVLELTFKAKEVLQPTTGMISVSSATLSDDKGIETKAASSAASIQVTNVIPPLADATLTADITAPTNTSVTVTISYPTDAKVKEYKVGASGTWAAYTGPVVLSVNETVYARGTDAVGNVSNVTSIVVSNIDKIAPVSVASLSPAAPNGSNGWYTSDVTVSFSVSDNVYGVAKTEYQVNNGGWITYTGSIPAFGEGNYTIGYRSTDLAGNVEPIKTIEFKIDKTAPILTVQLDKTSIWPANHKMVTINATLNSNDAASGVTSVVLTSITVDQPDSGQGDIGANIGTAATSFSLRAEKGRVYTITYTATDKAGNKTVTSVTVTVPHDQSGNH